MRIHFDKAEGYPPHSLSVGKIKCMLAVLPESWTATFKDVHVSNQIFEHRATERPASLSLYNKRLTLKDRSVSEPAMLRETFIEIAQQQPEHKTLRAHFGGKIDARQRKQLEAIVAPLMAAYQTEKDLAELEGRL